ncbi:MAG: tRNA uridine-5-carboxymethylaminomethyl(34) synthesis GTPase MnmE, partial [Methylococcus sp.]|nr:tRNA uridine-5-carboxymethylaminomethyl(34) synthesis GTPase MnmE [Methylococcus sp.]
RRTHTALISAKHHLDAKTAELLAEELHTAQNTLGEITGEVAQEELLTRIFSSFCIGK